MKLNLRHSTFVMLTALIGFSSNAFAQLPSPLPSHIVVIIEENYAYSQIIGSSYAPYINSLCSNPFSAVFTASYAITHPSQPNYMDLYSGADQGLTTDNPPSPSTYPYTTPNLGAQLFSASLTFKTYSEDMPSVGYDGTTYGLYARKHNPCANWVNTGTPGTNQYGTSVNVPFVGYFPNASNYASLPTVCYVVPNNVNDMHDGSIPAGDNWFHNHMDSLLTWALANNTLVILTWDEDDNAHGNQIPTIFFGPMVKGGTYSEHITHYSILRTMEALCGLTTYIGNAATATTITDCWRASGSGIWLNTNNLSNSYDFSVYPNPASTEITFNSNMPTGTEAFITICDAVGRIMGTCQMNDISLKVNTAAYAPGLYTYKVTTGKGSLAGQGKFVISHN